MKTRNLIIFVTLSALTMLSSFSEYGTTCQAQETELYPVRVNGKEGYIDATGRIVIKPQFDEVSECFSEGLAPVKVGEKWGYVDKTGRIVINPQFEKAAPFSEGLAEVKTNEKWGYIDKTGRIVINPQFDLTYPFSEGLARVYIGRALGFINKLGKYVVNPRSEFYCWGNYSEGFAATLYGDWYTGKHGFIDRTGQYYFNQSFSHVSSFSEGLAYVGIGDRDGFIDKSGNFVFYCQKEGYYSPFKEGMSCFSISKFDNVEGEPDAVLIEKKIGFINKTGRCVISPQFYEAEDFSEGVACVRIGGKYRVGRYGFIDKTGTYVINPQYDYAKSFRGGIAPMVINNQFYYIDKNGDIIWSSTELPSYISFSIEGVIRMEEYHKYRK